MKKIFAIVLLFVSANVFGQITITQSDLPVAGLAFINATDSTYNAPVSPGGANQTWNYASLVNLENDTAGFISSVGTPYAANFPNANLASTNINDGAWAYFISDATGFYINGVAGDSVFNTNIMEYNPPQLFVPVPFTYLDTRTNVSRLQFDFTDTTNFPFPVDVRFIQNIQSTFTGDGYGSLTTPTGNYPNTLRIAEVQLKTDSFMIDTAGTGYYFLVSQSATQNTNFRWFRHGTPALLIMSLEADSLGTTANRSEYLTVAIATSTNNLNNAGNKITAFPNPASDKINFNLSEFENKVATITVFDNTGKEIYNVKADNISEVKLNTSNLGNGIYFYKIISGTKECHGNFSVSK